MSDTPFLQQVASQNWRPSCHGKSLQDITSDGDFKVWSAILKGLCGNMNEKMGMLSKKTRDSEPTIIWLMDLSSKAQSGDFKRGQLGKKQLWVVSTPRKLLKSIDSIEPSCIPLQPLRDKTGLRPLAKLFLIALPPSENRMVTESRLHTWRSLSVAKY